MKAGEMKSVINADSRHPNYLTIICKVSSLKKKVSNIVSNNVKDFLKYDTF